MWIGLCFCISVSKNCEERIIGKICIAVKEITWHFYELSQHLPKMEGLVDQMSPKTTRKKNQPSWISQVDFKYAYSQLNYPMGLVDNVTLH